MVTTTPAGEVCGRLADYADLFRGVFGRADQARWLLPYLRGLLEPGRKNAEAIARRLGTADAPGGRLAQSLNNFLTSSPWDADALLARLREVALPDRGDPGRVWVVHDGALVRRGRTAVGCLPQYASPLGQKVNCQVAVTVGQVGASGYFPLAVRLYLPRGWLERCPPAARGRIPEPFRDGPAKADLARELLSRLREECGESPPVLAEPSYAALAGDGPRPAEADGPALRAARVGFDGLNRNLGLDQFIGRSWQGWHHHAALVFVAAGFRRWCGLA